VNALHVLGSATAAGLAALTIAAGPWANASQSAGPTAAVLFFDDFSGPALDRSRWNVIVTGRVVNNEQQAYVDSTDTIALVRGAGAEGATNGALAIRPIYRPGFKTPEGRTFDFVSGRLESQNKFEFTYGRAEARMKLPVGAGFWPAFWALGNGRWPETGEIDVMENVGDPSWVNSALHGPGYSGNTPLVKRFPFPNGTDVSTWHTYSVDWFPDRVVFQVDGQAYYEVTRATVEAHGAWAFDNPKFLIVNLALGGAYPRGVNKVEKPYVGLPAETVEKIKAGQGTVFVDWIRVTK
jgi:hypothetical protein